MKITKNLLTLLKNYNTLNTGIAFYENSPVFTISTSGITFASAELLSDDVIDKDFCIYDLAQFLNTIGLFDDHTLEFKSNWIEIKNDKQVVKYSYGVFETLNLISKEDSENYVINDDEVVAQFVVSKDDIEKILKSAGILKLKNVSFSNKGVKVFSADGTSNNDITLNVDVNCKVDYECIINIEALKIIPADYVIKIADMGTDEQGIKAGALEFKTNTVDAVETLRYIIVCDSVEPV